MIRGEHELDTRDQDLAILIHMDGQGTPAVKQQTWQAITSAAPAGVFFGWKDFYVKDHPMLDPRQTISRTPRLSMSAADHQQDTAALDDLVSVTIRFPSG